MISVGSTVVIKSVTSHKGVAHPLLAQDWRGKHGTVKAIVGRKKDKIWVEIPGDPPAKPIMLSDVEEAYLVEP